MIKFEGRSFVRSVGLLFGPRPHDPIRGQRPYFTFPFASFHRKSSPTTEKGVFETVRSGFLVPISSKADDRTFKHTIVTLTKI